jgi:hypothetical protein
MVQNDQGSNRCGIGVSLNAARIFRGGCGAILDAMAMSMSEAV